jgi:putative colanic acid biosysnthesis UDP-glucose lipid carrier transferase
MNKSQTNLFRFFFSFLDLLSIDIIHLILMLLINLRQLGDVNKYVLIFVVGNIAWLASAYIAGVYITGKLFEFTLFAKRTALAFLLFFTMELLFLFFYPYSFSKLFLSLDFLSIGLMLLITRLLFMLTGSYLRKKHQHMKKIVVLGYNDLSKQLVNHFLLLQKPVAIEGYFENYEDVHELSYFPILGMRFDCIPYAIKNHITEIYSTLSPEDNSYMYELAKTAEKNMIRFKFIPDFRIFVHSKFHIDFVEEIPVLSLRPEPMEDMAALIQKRLFDIIFSSLVIIGLLSWLLPLLAILIKINSKGPVFFVQLRSGKNNLPFKCFKFRSLIVNSDCDSKQVTKNDSRYTKLGKFLRKTNLDELPQFINVLLNDMSVVGPRPHMLQHTKDFSKVSNLYMVRHFAKPGVTGWAQVNGFRGEIKKEEHLSKRIEHDIWYLEHWSLWLDIRIVFQTIFLSLKVDKNAY